MRILLAPDKFKGSLSAPEVASHLAAGLHAVRPDLEVVLIPVGDGGEGTVDAAVAAGFERVSAVVDGPTGQPLTADFAVRGAEAVLEMAAASGLAVLPEGRLAPLEASSIGTGQLILAALDRGCTDIVLGVGGSACTDGGAGMLMGLGARFLDGQGRPVALGGGALAAVEHADLHGLDARLAECRFTLASDVDNPLLGRDGAAAVFGPQKGASPEDVEALESALERYFRVLANEYGTDAVAASDAPGSGAAGGVGYAALTVLGATRRPGIDVVLDFTHLGNQLTTADLVLTGEGSLDEQTLGGKAPLGVARAAAAAGVPVAAVCGRTTLDAATLRSAGLVRAYALTDLEPDPARCMAEAGALVERVGSIIAADIDTLLNEQETSYA